jgi:hypothetical protein
MRQHGATLLLVLAAALAACDGERAPTAPDRLQTEQQRGGGGGGEAQGDSTPPQLPGTFRAYGRVLAVSVTAASAGSSDTLRFTPVAGAAIEVWRNLLVDGAATQELAARTTSGADGAFEVPELAGGYYIVKAAPPAGSGYADNWEYLAGTASEVKVDVFVWKEP